MTLDAALSYWPVLFGFGGAFASLIIWLTRLESRVKALDGVAGAVGDLRTKMDLIWDVYISDVLKRQQQAGNVQHNSAMRLTNEFYARYGDRINPEIATTVRKMVREALPPSNGALAELILQRLTLPVAQERAQVFDVPVGEYVAIMVVWCRESEQYHREQGIG